MCCESRYSTVLWIMIVAGCSSGMGPGANDGSVAPGGGTVTCAHDSDCAGGDCEHVTGRTSGVCVDHCATAPCAAGYRERACY